MEESQPASSTSTTESKGLQALSKNAQKRLARAARAAEQKKERRAYEREKKKEKKRQQAEKREAGELGEEDEGGPRKKARLDVRKVPFKARIVVDLGFDDLMSENVRTSSVSNYTAEDCLHGTVQEIKSLTSQLAFTYSANRRATRPFESVLFTSLDKRTYVRLEEIGDAAYKRWNGTEWWHESYERLWGGYPSEQAIVSEVDENDRKETKNEKSLEDSNAQAAKEQQTAAQDSVVYLTADSSEELTELKEGETYIIGGICDHNRYKVLASDLNRHLLTAETHHFADDRISA
jgi:tRNA (guanine9-N1)-methyltransferase